MHLVSYLGFLIGFYGRSCKYVIISSDSDYDNIVKYWKKREKVSVKRLGKDAIKQSVAAKKIELEKNAAPSVVQQKVSASNPSPPVPAKPIIVPRNVNWNNFMQNAMNAAGFPADDGATVASIACKSRNETDFLNKVLEKVKEAFPDNEAILKAVETTILKAVSNPESLPKLCYCAPRTENKTNSIKNTVTQILAEARAKPETIADVAEIAAGCYDKDNAKQLLLASLIQRYEQENGQKVYNLIEYIFKD